MKFVNTGSRPISQILCFKEAVEEVMEDEDWSIAWPNYMMQLLLKTVLG